MENHQHVHFLLDMQVAKDVRNAFSNK